MQIENEILSQRGRVHVNQWTSSESAPELYYM